MSLKKRTGLTLTETLITITLLSIIVISTIGGFFVAKVGAVRAKHRTVAVGIVREYMEKEISNGYYFGQYFTFANNTPITTVVDGITYSIAPTPYPVGSGSEGSILYKIIGFTVTWNDPMYGSAGSVPCSERAVTYIAKHS